MFALGPKIGQTHRSAPTGVLSVYYKWVRQSIKITGWFANRLYSVGFRRVTPIVSDLAGGGALESNQSQHLGQSRSRFCRPGGTRFHRPRLIQGLVCTHKGRFVKRLKRTSLCRISRPNSRGFSWRKSDSPLLIPLVSKPARNSKPRIFLP